MNTMGGFPVYFSLDIFLGVGYDRYVMNITFNKDEERDSSARETSYSEPGVV